MSVGRLLNIVTDASEEWYTPPHIFDALGLTFDLDAAAPEDGVPWVPAARWYSKRDDALSQPWEGRVWLNPPYGPRVGQFLRRLAAHGDGVALVFARTDTRWWHETVPAARALCFIRGRLTFLDRDGRPGDGTSGASSVLIAYGADCAEAVTGCGLGMVMRLREAPLPGQASLWEAA